MTVGKNTVQEVLALMRLEDEESDAVEQISISDRTTLVLTAEKDGKLPIPQLNVCLLERSGPKIGGTISKIRYGIQCDCAAKWDNINL